MKELEQQFIETLNPSYNNRNANGRDFERRKKNKKEYNKAHKDECKKYRKEYNNQLCFYNGQTITLNVLSKRFRRAGIPHPTAEAKKYLLNKSKDK